ncbi:MAG: dihydropteroate synthase [Pirellulales bacterium]|nr:dihydropteroate synthase [Pirellulales bacterium]
MGILNTTPDSFSDGGWFYDAAAAIDQGLRLVAHGADILDIGGESTRPYSVPVDAEEELRRVMPALSALGARIDVPISIDTSKAAVAREALAAGAEIINDVSGLVRDPEMLALAVESGAGVCVMHMLGTPQTMQDDPQYEDVVEEVIDELRARRDALVAAGIPQQRIALDPGIGFGKKTSHNLQLLCNARRLHELGCPVLIGHSRKGYIGRVIGDDQADRTAGTIGTALAMACQGVQILRVHDVAPVRQALMLFEASGGLSPD